MRAEGEGAEVAGASGASAQVVVFTKVPVPGRVKTRLIPALGPEGAAALHTVLLHATLERVARSGLPAVVSVGGDWDSLRARSFLGGLRRRGVALWPQAEGDLGARMRAALGPGGGVQRRIALGSDCVVFEPAWLQRAAQSTAEVCLGATEDGGYWTIAVPCGDTGSFDRVAAAVFESVPWSASDTAAVTRARAAASGLDVEELPVCWDVDTPAELHRLLRTDAAPQAVKHAVTRLLAEWSAAG